VEESVRKYNKAIKDVRGSEMFLWMQGVFLGEETISATYET